MHFSLVKVVGSNPIHAKLFDDAILPFFFALRRLGYEVEILTNRLNPSSQNLVFGANVNSNAAWLRQPVNRTIINLEQFKNLSGGRFYDEYYLDLLSKSRVWDYSPRNIAYLKDNFGLEAGLFRFGYVQEMSRIRSNPNGQIDVLFYGGLNHWRLRIITQLAEMGIKVTCLDDCYGLERDRAIYEAKLVLNIHKGRPATLEMVRLGYLWANHKAVVSEFNDDTECYEGLETACACFPYEQLANGVREVLADEKQRCSLAEAGFQAFSGLCLTTELEKLVGRPSPQWSSSSRLTTDLPENLRVGAGDNFLNTALNIDHRPECNPDLVLDISRPLESGRIYDTGRFGLIELKPESFTRVEIDGDFNQAPDFSLAVLNCFSLLKPGGELIVIANYDFYLSSGCFEPFRSFNESNLADCELLPIDGLSFKLVSIDYILSDYGLALSEDGPSMKDLICRPRAVERMKIIMRKADTTVGDYPARSIFTGPVEEWETPGDQPTTIELNGRMTPPWVLRLELWRKVIALWRYKFNVWRFRGFKRLKYEQKLIRLRASLEKTRILLRIYSKH